MFHKKSFLYLGIVCFFINHAFAAEIRSLDKPSVYSLMQDDSVPTYRQMLDKLLELYVKKFQNNRIAQDIRLAIELFSQGTQEEKIYLEKEFDYTNFYQAKDLFFNAIADKSFPYPFKDKAKELTDGQGNTFYDVHYALRGILQYNAYQSTGGDS